MKNLFKNKVFISAILLFALILGFFSNVFATDLYDISNQVNYNFNDGFNYNYNVDTIDTFYTADFEFLIINDRLYIAVPDTIFYITNDNKLYTNHNDIVISRYRLNDGVFNLWYTEFPRRWCWSLFFI